MPASHKLPTIYGSGMGPASQKGAPFLGVPGNSLNRQLNGSFARELQPSVAVKQILKPTEGSTQSMVLPV